MDGVEFTGIEDTDRRILHELEDDDLFHACSSSKYAANLCNDKFWIKKFMDSYGVNLNEYGFSGSDYRDLYRRLRQMNEVQMLLFAATTGYLPLVEKIIASYEYTNAELNKALSMAATNCHLPVVIFLTEFGTRKGITFKTGDILISSAYKGCLPVVQYLAEIGPKYIIHVNNDDALRGAMIHNHFDVVKYLIDNGSQFMSDALLDVVTDGYLNILQYVLENVAKTKGNQQMQHQIHWSNNFLFRRAAEHGRLAIVKYLFEAIKSLEGEKAAVQMIHTLDDRALQRAATNSYLPVVRFLLENGADPSKLTPKLISKAVEKIIEDHVLKAKQKEELARAKKKQVPKQERCAAITAKGTQCKNKAKSGSEFCGVHS